MSIKSRTIWQYRALSLDPTTLEKALNEAGRDGFQVVHANHQFDGRDGDGKCFVLLSREIEVEEEVRLHG